MSYVSDLKVTLNPGGVPWVLLDYGDLLQEMPSFGAREGLEVIRIPYGSPKFNWDDTQVYALRFVQVIEAVSNVAAWQSLMQWVQTASSKDVLALRMEVQGAAYRWDFTQAAVPSPQGRPLGDGAHGHTREYDFTLSGMSQTAL